jgi:Integrase zinc binding domain
VDIFTVSANVIPDQDRPEGTVSFIQMSYDFVQKWSTALQEDRHHQSIFAELHEKIGDADQIESYGWVLKKVEDHLLLFVHKGDNGGLRPCIPTKMMQTVLEAAHDKQGHPGVHNTFATIRDHFYLPRMSAQVRSYVLSCPECARKRMAHVTEGSGLGVGEPEGTQHQGNHENARIEEDY